MAYDKRRRVRANRNAVIEAVERRRLMSAATHAVFTVQPTADATAGVPLQLTVSLEDAAGRTDAAQSSTVTLSIAAGPAGARIGGTGSAAAVGGVATINSAVLSVAGTYTLRAVAAGLTAGTSAVVTVDPAGAYRLSLASAANPAPSVAAGATLAPITVAVADVYGNVVTAAGGTVSVAPEVAVGSIDQDSDYLRGTTTEPVVDGRATFADLTVRHAGAMYLTFAGGEARNLNVPVPPVTPGPAAAVAFASVPTAVVAGQPWQPQVDVVDAYGNPVADPATVTLTTPLDTRTATAVAGVATFGTLSLTMTGQFTLTAAAPGLAAVTSAPFAVTPFGGVTQAAFLAQPAEVVAGQACGDVAVQLRDDFGNVAHDLDGTPLTVTLTKDGTVYSTSEAIVTDGQAVLLHGTVLTAAGTYAASVSDAAGATLGTSQPFAVAAGAAARLTAGWSAAVATAGRPIDPLTVRVEDAFGNLVSDGPPSLTATAIGTTLGGTTTATTAGGIATFAGLTVPVAGTFSLTLAGGSLVPATVMVRVRPPVLASTTFVAGRPVGPAAVDVAAYFPNYSPAAKGVRTVAVAMASPANAVGRPATRRVRIVNGVAAFRLPALRAAGTYTLTMTAPDGETAQQSFTVAPAAAARLAFVAPPVVTGGALTTSVQLLDRYGNAAAAAAGTVVTLSLAAPKVGGAVPVLSGAASVVADGNGLATFAGVTTPPVARGRLVATVAGLPAARSNPFDAG